MDTIDPWDKGEYSTEDRSYLGDIFYDFRRSGLRWTNKKDDDGKYIIHIRGLKKWLSGKVEQTEKFVLSCWRLRKAHENLLVEKARLVKKLEAVAGTSEIVDLGNIQGLHLWVEREFKGIMVPREHAERIVKAINQIAKDMRLKGFEEGSDILHRLGSGDLSVLDFEKKKEEMQDL